MTVAIHIPGHGDALAGLDWLLLPGLEGKRTEIRQLGRGVEAAWQFVWHSETEQYVTFVTQAESRKRPIAAPALVRQAIRDRTYLTLIDLGEGVLWSFAVKEDLPANKIDRVGDASQVMPWVRDFLSTLVDASQAPIYTDKPELFEGLPFALDIRPFSLDILAHSLKKWAFPKARFSGYSSLPAGSMVFGLIAVAAVGGFLAYQAYADGEARRNAMIARQHEAIQKEKQVVEQIARAINAAASAKVLIPAYMNAVDKLPLHIAGWRLSEVVCANAACTLTFEAQPFATWRGYVAARPANWPDPILGTNIQRVEQEIPVKLPPMALRTRDSLPSRQNLVLDLGNLAQVSQPIGVIIALENRGVPVATSSPAKGDVASTIPLKAGYTVSGSTVLLKDFSKRLPEVAGVVSLALHVRGKTTFDLTGEAYANP